MVALQGEQPPAARPPHPSLEEVRRPVNPSTMCRRGSLSMREPASATHSRALSNNGFQPDDVEQVLPDVDARAPGPLVRDAVPG